MSGLVMQANRFALDPTPAQERDLARHAGAARFAFNWALAQVKANLGQRAAERSGKRKGRKVGFPRFKSRRRARPSIRFTTGVIRVEPGHKHVTLPRVGTIKTHESTRKLARRLEIGTARIVSATVRCEARRWYCAFTVEIQRAARRPSHPQATVGVDLGITHLAVLSDGRVMANPRHLNKAMRGLRSASRTLSRRRGPDRPATQRPSKRWDRARQKVNRLHTRVGNLRKDGLHKLTSRLATTYGTIGLEDLNVAGMLRNWRLARHICDAGFGEIRRQLDYKTRWNGGRLVIADRWFASSKTCSDCGAAKPELSLSVRTFTCEYCGLVIDRDLNASVNLKQYVAQSGWETRNGRGADQKTGPGPAGGCETSIPHQVAVQDGNLRLVTGESLGTT